MTHLDVEPYTQHDWSNASWALMLAVMVTAVFTAMVVFLLVATRDKRSHPPRTRRHG